MKITGWTWYDNTDFEEMFLPGSDYTMAEVEEVQAMIASELRSKGYKFTGSYHQDGDFGAPIIDGTKIYMCSCRMWGHIMALAYPEEIDNSDGHGYVKWAWTPPEQMVIPGELDYE